MEEERRVDAGWYMDRLEQRLFNRDAEGMLAERLGEEEVYWAADASLCPSAPVRAAFPAMDCWLGNENTLPSGPCMPSFPPHEAPADFGISDLKEFMRKTQVLELFNSFGVGVFVAGLHTAIAEVACEGAEEPQLNLQSFLELLSTSPTFRLSNRSTREEALRARASLDPEDLEDNRGNPWARRMERNIRQVRKRTGLNDALRPLHELYCFGWRRGPLLPSRQFRAGKRGMFLAGMMAAGLEPQGLLQAETASPACPEGHRRTSGEAEGQPQEGPQGIFFLSDNELERCLPEASIRADVEEELEFRLRNNRLSRMLAHLKRISRGQQEERDDDE